MGGNCCKCDSAKKRTAAASSTYTSRSRTGGALDSRWNSSSDGVRATLTTESATLADSGEYVIHSSGVPRKRMRLEVRGRTPADVDNSSPFFLRRLTDLAVKVGTRTRLIVEIQTDSEVQVTWYRNSRRLQPSASVNITCEGRFHCLELTASAPEDSGRWTCAAANKTGRAECSAHLNVIVPKAYKRPEFLEELRAILTDQGTVSLECKVIGVPTPTLRWFKDSEEIRAGDVFALTANPEDATSLGIYTCEATNCMGKAYSSSKVHVVGRGSREGSLKPADSVISSEPPPVFMTELQEQRIKIGEPLELSCRVGVPPWPKSVVWYNKNGRADPTECTALEDGAGGLRLNISSVTWDHEGEWKCVASSAGGRLSVSTCYVNVDVPKNYRKPRFMENLKAVLTEEGLVSFECKVVGFPTPQLSWFKDGLELKPGDVYQLTGSNSLGSYCCIAKNCMGQASSQAELTVEDIQSQLDDEERMQLFSENKAPKFVQVLKSQEARINEEFRFSVKVSISPEPTLTWYRDDQPIDDSPRYKIIKESKGVYHLDIRQLEITDQAEWKCVATNEFGHSVTSCFLKLIIPKHFKKPRFLENLRAILSEEGAVNLECKVIGVPQPTLKWYKDGEELKPGDIHRIISGQDGTCCLGTYTCEAQNCMGIAASSASLLGFEDNMKSGKILTRTEPEPLQRNISLSTIHEERTSQLYDTPAGDVTIDEKGEISFSFSGKEVSVSLYETPDLTEEEALQIVEMYADQLSENITEQNVVELPPLRFVKETSTSGNLLMEAIVIDVSPDYFVSPEDDMRTEADMEDMSIVEDLGISTFPVEVTEVPVLHHTAEEIPARPPRKKSESVKSGEDFYSLSKERSESKSEKRKLKEVTSESDQQSYKTVGSLEASKSDDLQTPPDYKKTEDQLTFDKTGKAKRRRKESGGSRRSSTGSEKSLEMDVITILTPKIVEEITKRANTVTKISKVIQSQLNAIEDEVILQSAHMSSAGTAKKSLEVIESLKTPLANIQNISNNIKDDCVTGDKIISNFQSYREHLKSLHQNLAVIEKCVEIEGGGRTLVQRTSICLVETLSKPIQSIFMVLKDICSTLQSHHSSRNMKEINHILDDTINALLLSEESIKSVNLIKEASEIPQKNIEERPIKDEKENANIIQNVWKPILKLQKSLESVKQNICIEQDINMREYVVSLITRPIQELQNALETLEEGAVKESNEKLYDINSVILQGIFDPMLVLRNDLDSLKTEMSPKVLENTLNNVVNSIQEIKSNLINIGEKFDIKDIEPFEENQNMIQNIARNLITLQSNIESLANREKCVTLIEKFDRLQINLAKLLESALSLTPYESLHILKNISTPAQKLNESFNYLKTEKMSEFVENAIASIDVLRENITNIQLPENINVNDCLHSSITSIDDLKSSIDKQVFEEHPLKLQENVVRLNEIANKINHHLSLVSEMQHSTDEVEELKYVQNVENLTKLANIMLELRDQIGSTETKVHGPFESINALPDISLVEELANPLNELNCSLNIVAQQVCDDYESLETANSDLSALKILIKPLQDFHENLTVLQHNVQSEIGCLESFVAESSIAKTLQQLESCLVEIHNQCAMEAADDMSTLQDISGMKSIADVKHPIETVAIKTVDIPLDTIEPLFEGSLKDAFHSLYDGLANLQNSLQIDDVNKFTYSPLKSFVECVINLKSKLDTYDILEADVRKNDILQYQDVMNSLVDLQKFLEDIVSTKSKDITGEVNIDEETFKKLHTITESILDLQHNIYSVNDSMIHSKDKAVEKLSSQRENLALKTEPQQFENIEDMSTVSDISALKSLAVPLQDLKQAIGAVQQQTRQWETHDELLRPEIQNVNEKLKISLQEVLDGVAAVQSVFTDELANSMSEKLVSSDIKHLAQPLQDLTEKIIAVQENLVCQPHDAEHSIKDFSYDATLAEILVSAERCYAVLEEHDLLEPSQFSDLSVRVDGEEYANEDVEKEILLKTTIVDNTLAVFTDIQNTSTISQHFDAAERLNKMKNSVVTLQAMLKEPLAKIISNRNEMNMLLSKTEEDLNNFEVNILASKIGKEETESVKKYLNILNKNLKSIHDMLTVIFNFNKQREIVTPLKIIKKFTCAVESIPLTLSKQMPILETIIPPLQEICHQFELADLNSNTEQHSDVTVQTSNIIDSVKNMSDGINDFLVTNDNADNSSIKVHISDLRNILNTDIKEHSTAEIVNKSFLKNISKPLLQVANLISDTDNDCTNVPESLKSTITSLVEPIRKVQDCLSVLQKQLECLSDDDTITVDLSLNESYAEPVIEIQKELTNFEGCVITGEELPPESQMSHLNEMEKCLHTFQESILSMEQTLPTHEKKCLDLLKSSISEMENTMHKLEENIVTEIAHEGKAKNLSALTYESHHVESMAENHNENLKNILVGNSLTECIKPLEELLSAVNVLETSNYATCKDISPINLINSAIANVKTMTDTISNISHCTQVFQAPEIKILEKNLDDVTTPIKEIIKYVASMKEIIPGEDISSSLHLAIIEKTLTKINQVVNIESDIDVKHKNYEAHSALLKFNNNIFEENRKRLQENVIKVVTEMPTSLSIMNEKLKKFKAVLLTVETKDLGIVSQLLNKICEAENIIDEVMLHETSISVEKVDNLSSLVIDITQCVTEIKNINQIFNNNTLHDSEIQIPEEKKSSLEKITKVMTDLINTDVSKNIQDLKYAKEIIDNLLTVNEVETEFIAASVKDLKECMKCTESGVLLCSEDVKIQLVDSLTNTLQQKDNLLRILGEVMVDEIENYLIKLKSNLNEVVDDTETFGNSVSSNSLNKSKLMKLKEPLIELKLCIVEAQKVKVSDTSGKAENAIEMSPTVQNLLQNINDFIDKACDTNIDNVEKALFTDLVKNVNDVKEMVINEPYEQQLTDEEFISTASFSDVLETVNNQLLSIYNEESAENTTMDELVFAEKSILDICIDRELNNQGNIMDDAVAVILELTKIAEENKEYENISSIKISDIRDSFVKAKNLFEKPLAEIILNRKQIICLVGQANLLIENFENTELNKNVKNADLKNSLASSVSVIKDSLTRMTGTIKKLNFYCRQSNYLRPIKNMETFINLSNKISEFKSVPKSILKITEMSSPITDVCQKFREADNLSPNELKSDDMAVDIGNLKDSLQLLYDKALNVDQTMSENVASEEILTFAVTDIIKIANTIIHDSSVKVVDCQTLKLLSEPILKLSSILSEYCAKTENSLESSDEHALPMINKVIETTEKENDIESVMNKANECEMDKDINITEITPMEVGDGTENAKNEIEPVTERRLSDEVGQMQTSTEISKEEEKATSECDVNRKQILVKEETKIDEMVKSDKILDDKLESVKEDVILETDTQVGRVSRDKGNLENVENSEKIDSLSENEIKQKTEEHMKSEKDKVKSAKDLNEKTEIGKKQKTEQNAEAEQAVEEKTESENINKAHELEIEKTESGVKDIAEPGARGNNEIAIKKAEDQENEKAGKCVQKQPDEWAEKAEMEAMKVEEKVKDEQVVRDKKELDAINDAAIQNKDVNEHVVEEWETEKVESEIKTKADKVAKDTAKLESINIEAEEQIKDERASKEKVELEADNKANVQIKEKNEKDPNVQEMKGEEESKIQDEQNKEKLDENNVAETTKEKYENEIIVMSEKQEEVKAEQEDLTKAEMITKDKTLKHPKETEEKDKLVLEAKNKAERDAQEKSEEEIKKNEERDAIDKAERLTKEKEERDAKERLENQVKEKEAEIEKLELEAKDKDKAKSDPREKSEEEIREKADNEKLKIEAKTITEKYAKETAKTETKEQLDFEEKQKAESDETEKAEKKAIEKAENKKLDTEAKQKAEGDAREATEITERDKLDIETKEKAEWDAKGKAEQEVKIKADKKKLDLEEKEKAERDAKENTENKTNEKADKETHDLEAKEKKECDAKEIAEKDEKENVDNEKLDLEAMNSAEREANEKAKKEKENEEIENLALEAKNKAEHDEKEKAEKESKEKVEKEILDLEAKNTIEQEAKEKSENEAEENDEKEELDLEAKKKVERDAKEKTEKEAKERVEKEKQEIESKAKLDTKAKTEIEANEKLDSEAKTISEREAEENAEKEARENTDNEKLELKEKEKVEHESKKKAEKEAKEGAEKENMVIEAKNKVEQDAKDNYEKEENEKLFLEANNKAEQNCKEKAEKEEKEKLVLEEKNNEEQDAKEKADKETKEKEEKEKLVLEAKNKAEQEAKEKSDKEEKEKLALEANKRTEQEAKEKAEKEDKEKAEKEKLVLEANNRAEQEAKEKAEKEDKEKAEKEKVDIEVKEKSERESKEKAEKEAKRKAKKEKLDLDAKNKAEQETKEKAEKEAKEKEEKEKLALESNKRAEQEAKEKAEKEAKEKADKEKLSLEAKLKAEQEAKVKADKEAKAKKETEKLALEANKRAEQEVKEKAEKEAKEKEETEKLALEANKRAEQEVKEKAEKEAKEKADKEKLDLETKAKAESDAKEKAEKEAKRKAKQEKLDLEAKNKAEQDAKEKAEKEEKEKIVLEAKNKAEQDAKEKAKKEAKEKEEKDKLVLEAKSKAEQEVKEKSDKEKKEKLALEANKIAEQEAKEKAEREAKEKAEKEKLDIEVKEKAERDAIEKAEKEAKEKEEKEKLALEANKRAEQEAKEKAEKEAKEKADKEKLDLEAKEKAERDAIEKAEKDAKEKEEKEKLALEANKRAEQEAKEKAEKEAKEKAVKEKLDLEAKNKAEQEAKEKADKEAKEEKEKLALEANKKAEQEAKEKAEKEAKEKADKEKLDLEAKEKSDRDAKEKTEKEAKRKAKKEKLDLDAKNKAEQEAKEKVDKEAMEKEEKEKLAIEANKRAEQEAKEKAEKEAKEKEDKVKLDLEAKEKAERDAKEKAEKEAKEKADKEKLDLETKKKAEQEAKEKADKEAKEKEEKEKLALEANKRAEQEAKEKAEKEAKEKADKEKLDFEAKEKADRDAKEKAEKEAKRKAKKEKLVLEAKNKADQKAKEKTEKEAKEKAEKEKLDLDAKENAERDAKEKDEKEAKEKAKQEKLDLEAKNKAEQEAQEKVDKEAKEKEEKEKLALEANKRAEHEAKEKTEKEAMEKAEKEQLETDAKNKADKEYIEKADKEKLDLEAKNKAERDAKEKTENEAKDKADKETLVLEARNKAEQDGKEKTEKYAMEKADKEKLALEAKNQAERDFKENAEKDAIEELILNAKNKTEKDTKENAETQAKEENDAVEKTERDANEKSTKDKAELKAKKKAKKDGKEKAEKQYIAKTEEGETKKTAEQVVWAEDDTNKHATVETMNMAKDLFDATKPIAISQGIINNQIDLIQGDVMREPEINILYETESKGTVDSRLELNKERFSEMRKISPIMENTESKFGINKDTSYEEEKEMRADLGKDRYRNYLGKSKGDDVIDDKYKKTDSVTKRTDKSYKSDSEAPSSLSHSSLTKTPGPRDSKKKPLFSTRLTDRTAVEGSRVKLTCSVLGTPEPNVQWFKNGVLLMDKNKYLSKYHDGLATLEVLNAEPFDSADYTCTATNENGTSSCSASLKVYAGVETTPIPPTFTRSIKDTYHVAEDEMVLECRIRGQPRPVITWLRDGKTLTSESRYQMNYLADGVCRLIINRPDPSDTGKYTCRAENPLWSDEITHHVQFAGRDLHLAASPHRFETVRSVRSAHESRRPYFSRVLADHAVPIGGTIALQVEIGGGKAEVEWRRGGAPLPRTERVREYVEKGVYTLAVESVSVEESGIYTCTVKNEHGSVDTTATVSVLPPGVLRSGKTATIVSRPESDVSVTEGEDFTISLRAQGDPKPKVIWMKGLRDITNSWKSLKENSDDYFRFTLKRALMSDTGTYCIMAKNCYGCDRAFVTLFVRQRLDSDHYESDKSEYSYSDVSNIRDVPQAIVGEPEVSDRGKDWVSLRWPKPPRGPQAPVLAYRVDAWLQGAEGGARWQSLGLTPVNGFDAFQLTPGAYLFRVTPRNRYGWAPSIQTKEPISVGGTMRLPEFTTPLPGQVKVLVGDSVTLSCAVSAIPSPTIVWYKDGQEIDGGVTSAGGRCVLHIAKIEQNHEGRYTCEAIGPEGKAATFSRLYVVGDKKIFEADENFKKYLESDTLECAPVFSMRLRDRRVQVTYPVRLTCRVEGRPAPLVTWTKDGEVIEQNDRFSFWVSERFHTLEISSAMLDDAGKYSAHAANPLGAVRCSSVLTVDKGLRAYLAPDFVLAPDTLYRVPEGSELRIRAAVEAYPSVGVSWHRDGLRLRPSRRTLFTLDRDGELEMALAYVTRRDSGIYTVTASNEVGKAMCSTRVEVTAPDAGNHSKDNTPLLFSPSIPYSKEPIFIKKPRSSEAKEGDTVVILCEVAGDPKPEVLWLRDFLKPEYYRDAAQFRRIGAGPEYHLEIPHCKLDHTGTYTVIASNCHGQSKAIISLQIYAKGPDEMDQRTVTTGRIHVLPKIIRDLKDMRCCDGDSVTFECLVQGTPSPLVQWEKDGQLIHECEDFKMETDDGEVAHLTISCVYPEDEGVYTCTAYNELGKVYTSSCLIVDVPEEKENLLNQQLTRPPMLLSAGSTPRSTPRSTPCRSMSPQPHHRVLRSRDSMSQTPSRTSRWKLAPPKFFAVPFNRVAEEGENVSFRCSIAGHPVPKVYWDKDGSEIQLNPRISIREKEDDRILTINSVKYEDSGLYKVTLENEAGSVEATAYLDVINLKGMSPSMRLTENSRTSPYVRRHVNGSHYRVGERLRLSGEIKGSPTPKSKWYRNGQVLEMNDGVFEIVEGDNYTLIINSVEKSDGGVYTLVATNELGCASSWTKVNIETHIMNGGMKCIGEHQPHIIKHLSNMIVIEGRATEIQLVVENCCIFTFTWIKNNTVLPDSDIYKYVDYGNGVIGLRMEDIYMQDEGVYTCIIRNGFGSAKSSGKIQVKESNVGIAFNGFKAFPEPVLVEEGDDATFQLVIGSETKINNGKAVWQVSGKEVTETSSKYKLTNDGCNFTLKINNVQGSDSGYVRCAVRVPMLQGNNEIDQHESLWYTTQLSVVPGTFLNKTMDTGVSTGLMHIKPSFISKIENVIIPIGGKALFNAHFYGYPEPSVTWFMLDREISPCKRFNINNSTSNTTLEISDAELSDSAVYKVIIKNGQGIDSMSALLQVENADTLSDNAPLYHIDDGMLFDTQYSIHNVIGRGHFGSVKLIKNKKSGEQLAAKFVKILKQKDKEVIMSELEILHCLKHPKLIQLVDAFMKPNQMIIITEYISGGQLFERVSEEDFTLTEGDCILFMTQILEGVAFMHSKNIVHLDLKPENIMCHTRPSHEIKIIDFGLAKRLHPNEEIRTLCGTAEFIAPEIVNFDPISTASDMWSIGVICYILLSGLSPFAGDTVQETYSNILRVKYDFEDEAFDQISEDAKNFITDLLVKPMDKRPSAAKCLQNKWMMQHQQTGSATALSTEKLRKFVIQSKWQMTGNAIRAVGRMASLCAISRMNTTRIPNKSDKQITIVKTPIIEDSN